MFYKCSISFLALKPRCSVHLYGLSDLCGTLVPNQHKRSKDYCHLFHILNQTEVYPALERDFFKREPFFLLQFDRLLKTQAKSASSCWDIETDSSCQFAGGQQEQQQDGVFSMLIGRKVNDVNTQYLNINLLCGKTHKSSKFERSPGMQVAHYEIALQGIFFFFTAVSL